MEKNENENDILELFLEQNHSLQKYFLKNFFFSFSKNISGESDFAPEKFQNVILENEPGKDCQK